ncbi:MAG: transporter substrate-binding domain-containing protein [bacterium]|nr:transporter substrate-binding domain-containing protein [bacterium]
MPKKSGNHSQPIQLFAKLISWPILPLALSLWLGTSCAKLQHHDDFQKIAQTGELRVGFWVTPAEGGTGLVDPLVAEGRKLTEFALDLGLTAKFISFEGPEEMARALDREQIDLASFGMEPGPAAKNLAASVAYLRRDLILVGPSGTLAGTLCIRRQSPQAALIRRIGPPKGFKLKELSPFLSHHDLLERRLENQCDALLLDSYYWAQRAAEYKDLKKLAVFAPDQPLAFYFRDHSTGLRQRANEFLIYQALAGQGDPYQQHSGSRRKLRVLTRNHLMSFFLSEGNHYGLEYELLQDFAIKQGYKLEILVPSFHSDLIPWLIENKGDLIAASMSITKERARQIAFSRPYHQTRELVVLRQGDRRIGGLKDLKGQKIWVRRSSSYYDSLIQVQKLVGPIDIQLVGEDVETEQLFEQLETRQIDALVADAHQLEAERTFGRKVYGAVGLPLRRSLAFGMTPNDVALKQELDQYLAQVDRNGFLKIIKEKYTENRTLITKARSLARADTHGEISPFDQTIQAVALDFNLDWRLVASQMYQESRFDPLRRSQAGALGLMQVMPATGREMGLKVPEIDLKEPQKAIQTGVKYLRKTFDRLEEVPRLEDRIFFSLAAYNAGYGHLTDARTLAKRLGLDPDRWAGQVERAILLLEQPKYYRTVRYGYCRGSEPINYVREIQKRYVMYTQFVPTPGW